MVFVATVLVGSEAITLLHEYPFMDFNIKKKKICYYSYHLDIVVVSFNFATTTYLLLFSHIHSDKVILDD